MNTDNDMDWWTFPLMIVLSPFYILIAIAIAVFALILLIIGIIMAGWDKVTTQ